LGFIKPGKEQDMKKTLLAAALMLAGFAAVITAQGLIIPDRPRPDWRYQDFELKSIAVTAKIDNQGAVTTVQQVFYNPNNFVMEAEYIFILPENSVATGLSMWMNGKKVKGELLDKDKARKIYRDIVSRMKDPALLEYIDRNIFKAHIYPIPARGEQKIEIEYHQQLPVSGGIVEYRYPLRAEKLYKKTIGSFSLDVSIKSNEDIKSVYCPTHNLDIDKKNDRSARASFEKRDLEPTRDIQLFYTLDDKEFGLSLLTYRPDTDEDGYFMMLIAPRTKIDEDDIQEKDVIFVLDRSGSMEDDDKISQAIRSLKFGVNSLNANDRFNIITFSTEEKTFAEKMIKASDENKKKAISFLKKTDASGGTNIYDALKAALRMLTDSDRHQTIVFLTDGLPTVGETDTKAILNMVREKGSKKCRIFCYGLGYDVNTHLLDLISSENNGTSDYVKPGEDMEVKLSSFFTKINFPVLTDLEIDYGRIDADKICPKNLPDLFKGGQLVVYGRYSKGGSTAITLEGRMNRKKTKFVYDATFSKDDDDHAFIAHLWASRRIGYLLDEIRLRGENNELVDEVVKLSKKFGIVTPYTSYLVAEDEKQPVDRRWRDRDEERYYFSRKTNGLKGGSPAQAPSVSGEAAVYEAQEMKKLKEESTVSDKDQAENIRRIAGKTFQLKNDIWVDSEFKNDMKTKKIKFGSTEYFDLIQATPELAKFLSIGTKVIVVYKGKVYEITE
jgi:Ca-activated chloride channel family protein